MVCTALTHADLHPLHPDDEDHGDDTDSHPLPKGPAPRVRSLDHNPDPGFSHSAPEEWGKPTRDAGFDDIHPEDFGPGTRDSGFDLPQQDMRRALRNRGDSPAPDTPEEDSPAPRVRSLAPEPAHGMIGRLFEKRQTPGFTPPEGRPEFHDLVYRTHGESPSKPEMRDLLYRFNGSPEEAGEHARSFFQNVADRPQLLSASVSTADETPSKAKSTKKQSEDRPLGYKVKKSPPVKNDALIQKDKVIKSSTIPKSEQGLAVLREFFNPDARNIDELNNSMRKALDGDKALILQLNSNGEHSGIIAIHLDEKGNLVNTLYDPAGSYTGKNHQKGSGDVLTNEFPANGPKHVGWSLADYIDYHATDGSMSFVPIWTDGKTARSLDYTPNTMKGFCALSSRDVIQQIPGFTKSWGFRPVSPNDLSNQLHQLMGRKVTIQHQP